MLVFSTTLYEKIIIVKREREIEEGEREVGRGGINVSDGQKTESTSHDLRLLKL